mmetsp:Transcript_69147/g.122093  ORF Transcript_69147/g.122093 Transcript_69147/m.122093 type:complete len:207 (-) Transcript_69147:4416-5036(-)
MLIDLHTDPVPFSFMDTDSVNQPHCLSRHPHKDNCHTNLEHCLNNSNHILHTLTPHWVLHLLQCRVKVKHSVMWYMVSVLAHWVANPDSVPVFCLPDLQPDGSTHCITDKLPQPHHFTDKILLLPICVPVITDTLHAFMDNFRIPNHLLLPVCLHPPVLFSLIHDQRKPQQGLQQVRHLDSHHHQSTECQPVTIPVEPYPLPQLVT